MNAQVGAAQDISVIGLGAMGSGIARTFVQAGYRVSVWNRSREKIDAMAALGAIACNGPRDALNASGHVVVCLADYPTWKRVVEEHGLQDAFEGKCIIQLTGGTIDDVREHASFIGEHGGRIVEGAVMCFPRQLGTTDGSLLVSGAPGELDECDSLLRALAPAWTNLGDDVARPAVLSRALTAGIVTSLVGLVNGIALCRAGGISLDIYLQQIEKADAFLPEEKCRLIKAVRDGHTEETEASIRTWAEAHQTIHSVAGTLGTNLVLQDAVRAVFEEGHRIGLGDQDLSALVGVFASDRE